jgi:hypothetical protein
MKRNQNVLAMLCPEGGLLRWVVRSLHKREVDGSIPPPPVQWIPGCFLFLCFCFSPSGCICIEDPGGIRQKMPSSAQVPQPAGFARLALVVQHLGVCDTACLVRASDLFGALQLISSSCRTICSAPATACGPFLFPLASWGD